MMWQTDGMSLEDLVPVPKKQPGRHFSSGYHVIGHVTPSYDNKYAQMAYGDHYRKKVIDDIQHERDRLGEILMEQKRQEAAKKDALAAALKSRPRYNLNELRHNQRRCAALLFGARPKGAHNVPLLVRWAPPRRESYYLMSERVYNDRMLMKLREQEEEERRRMLASPLNFDFVDKLVDTSHLYDFQKLINKTSKDLKGMQFDTQYNEYIYDFTEADRKRFEDEEGRASLSPSKGEDGKSCISQSTTSKQRVMFSDKASEHGSEGRQSRVKREGRKSKRSILKRGGTSDVGMEDIDVSLEGDLNAESDTEGEGAEDHRLNSLLTAMSFKGSTNQTDERISKRSRRKRIALSFDSDADPSMRDSQRGISYSERSDDEQSWDGDELSDLGGIHNNKYCKHSPTSLKKRAQDYYKKLPRLLKTSELREKVVKLRKPKPTEKPTGPFATHKCMEPHKTAYERALALVRGRSLPSDPANLLNRTTRLTFSYFPGLPGTETRTIKGKRGKNKKLSGDGPKPAGLAGIFGNVDMNDFYREEDELVYYVKHDELRAVAETSKGGKVDDDDYDDWLDDDDDDNDDDDDDDDKVTETVTRATSESYTLKLPSSMDDTDNDSQLS